MVPLKAQKKLETFWIYTSRKYWQKKNYLNLHKIHLDEAHVDSLQF
jgi:hypothetical protein